MLAYKAKGKQPTMDMDKVESWLTEGLTVYVRRYFGYRGGGTWAYGSSWKVWKHPIRKEQT